MLFCDSCDRGWHRQHLNPPLATIPRGRWTCPTCVKEANFFDAPLELGQGQKRTRKQAQPIGILSASGQGHASEGFEEEDSRVSRRASGRSRRSTSGGTGFGEGGFGTEDDDFDEMSLLGTGRPDRKGKNRANQYSEYEGGAAGPSSHLLGAGSLPSTYEDHPVVKVPNSQPFPNPFTPYFPPTPLTSTPHNPSLRFNPNYSRPSMSTPNQNSALKSRPLKRQRSSNARDNNSTPFPDQPWLLPRPPPSPTPEEEYHNTNSDQQQPEDPYGGLLSAEESRTDGRIPQDKDRKRVKAAKELVDRRELGLMKRLEKEEGERRREERRKMNEKSAVAVATGEGGVGAILDPNLLGEGAGSSLNDGGTAGHGTPGGPEQRELRTHRPASSTLIDSLTTPSNNNSLLLNNIGGSASAALAATVANPDDLLPILPPGYTGLPIRPITSLVFPPYEIKTWYQAPFPEEYTRTPDGKLWVCEGCLKYFRGEFEWSRHRASSVTPFHFALDCTDEGHLRSAQVQHATSSWRRNLPRRFDLGFRG